VSVRDALYSLLTSNGVGVGSDTNRVAALQALYSKVATRVSPADSPENVGSSRIVYTRISEPRVQSHQGFSGAAHPRYQLDCLARDDDTADAVAENLKAGIDGYSGTAAGVVYLQSVLVLDEGDTLDPDAGKNINRTYGRRVDVEIWYTP